MTTRPADQTREYIVHIGGRYTNRVEAISARAAVREPNGTGWATEWWDRQGHQVRVQVAATKEFVSEELWR